MKRCSKCHATKPVSSFYKNKKRKDGFNNQCKDCQTQSNKEYRVGKGKQTQRAYWLNKKYGMTEEQRDKLLEWSRGGCAICGSRPEAAKLDVDHNHTTGKIRGILCRSCNLALGMFKDDRRRLQIAIAYLDYFDDEPDS